MRIFKLLAGYKHLFLSGTGAVALAFLAGADHQMDLNEQARADKALKEYCALPSHIEGLCIAAPINQ